MAGSLEGKVAVVTGASRGIGFHIARKIHDAGARVAVTGRNPVTLERAASRIGDRCFPVVCDQSRPEEIPPAADKILGDLGTPDVLVCNAGVMKRAPVHEMPLDLWREVIDTNLTGTFLVVQAFLPSMIRKQRGDIVIISSMSGKKGDPGSSVYNASKFGLQGFAQALTYEVRRSNVRVMVLNPSSVDTGDDTGPEYGPGLYLHAADIAETVLHLVTLPGRTLIRDMDIWGTNPP